MAEISIEIDDFRDNPRPRLQSLRITNPLPQLYQLHPLECGIACVAMLAAYFGLPVSRERLSRLYPVSTYGLSLITIVEMLEGLGFKPAAIECSIDELLNFPDPCILHLDYGHYVVLRRATFRRAYVHDPNRGVEKVLLEKIALNFQGTVVVIFPDEGRAPAGTSLVRLRF